MYRSTHTHIHTSKLLDDDELLLDEDELLCEEELLLDDDELDEDDELAMKLQSLPAQSPRHMHVPKSG